ncbi:MAG: gamma-glutamyltransferase family protein, partial [Alphaproteobacteria bacterium]|nr:gamma-glutamyltransferase family protein [Alphaproteobacteria bacterium]
NAFDAAVAAGFTLQIVEPHLNGPAGEVPILFAKAGQDKATVLCGQGVAPQAATIEHFKSLDLSLVPGTGLLSAVVPGAFDAWMLLLRDHGTWSLADVLAPAIHYAEHGQPLLPTTADVIARMKGLFETEWTTSATLYLNKGHAPAANTLFRNLVLAETYKTLVKNATGTNRDAEIELARILWRDGFVAETIDSFCRTTEAMDTSGRRHGGLLTGDDLARWTASYEDPATLDYHGYTVCKTGPWGQGPVFLQQLALLSGYDIAAMEPAGPDFVHTVVECAKLAFADREAFYGDPNFADVPLETLLSADYANTRRGLIGEMASLDLRPGDIAGYGGPIGVGDTSPAGGQDLGEFGAGEPTVAKTGETRGDTCHLDVIDRHGNMVSATPSGGWLQGSPAIPDLGFCLNTRAQMFWLDERSPNALAPGKRPRTTLTPSLALRDDKPYIAFGTPGGDQQDQWSTTFFLRHVHHGMNLQEAIDAPSFHSEHWPNSFYPRLAKPGRLVAEGRFTAQTLDELSRRGHDIVVASDWSEGRLSACANDGDLMRAAANPRGMQGYAVGR